MPKISIIHYVTHGREYKTQFQLVIHYKRKKAIMNNCMEKLLYGILKQDKSEKQSIYKPESTHEF